MKKHHHNQILLCLKLLLILFVLLISAPAICQSTDSSIAEIDKIISEIGKYTKNKGLITSKEAHIGNYKQAYFDFTGQKIYTSATKSYYINGYSKLTYHIDRWELGLYSEHFYLKGVLFFEYFIELTVSGDLEYKLYYDTSGNAIKIELKNDLPMEENDMKQLEDNKYEMVDALKYRVQEAKKLLNSVKKVYHQKPKK